jgi:branched-subunit amino acid aminotransferase/4-amino-4-deoxychorismate lyase
MGSREYFWLDGNRVTDSRWSQVYQNNGYGITGCFETVRLSKGRVFNLRLHLARFQNGLQKFGIEIPDWAASENALANWLLQQCPPIKQGNWRIRWEVRLTGLPFRTSLSIAPLKKRGALRLLAVTYPNCNKWGPDVKASNRAAYTSLSKVAVNLGCHQALILDENGSVQETDRGNLWVKTPEGWVTPPPANGMIFGTTAALLEQFFELHSIPHARKALSMDDILNASHAFVTNALYPHQPVFEIVDEKDNVFALKTEGTLPEWWQRFKVFERKYAYPL